MAGEVFSPDQDEQEVTDEERAAAARAGARSTFWPWSDEEFDRMDQQIETVGDIIKTETDSRGRKVRDKFMPKPEQQSPHEAMEAVTEKTEQRLQELLSTNELPRQEQLKETLSGILSVLAHEPDAVREKDRDKEPGGVVRLRNDVDTLIISDIHARREYLAKALLQKDDDGRTNLEKMMQGELQVVCMGDGMHAEARAAERWTAAKEEFDNNFAQSPNMDAEMVESLGVMQMVMELKQASPENFHYLKGNHDNITNRSGGGDHGFIKYASEGPMVAKWMNAKYGTEILKDYDEFEVRMPLVAVGNNFAISHAEPKRAFTKDEIVNCRALDGNTEVVEGLTWTDEDARAQDAIENTLAGVFGRYAKSGEDYWFAGHRHVAGEPYHLAPDGLIRVNSDKEMMIVYISKNAEINPAEQVHNVKEVELEEQELAAVVPEPTTTPTPRIPPPTPPPAAARPRPAAPRVEPAAVVPRVEPARVEPARPTVAAPETATRTATRTAREPLSAAEQELAKRLMEQYHHNFVPESSAEPYFGERGSKIEQIPVAEKRDFANIFQEEMHATMVKNKRDIEMGRKTPEQIAAEMSKEEIFFTYFSDPEHLETREDLVGLGHSLTLLMEKRLAAYYGVREYKFDEEFKGDSQKESDVAFVKFLHTEMGLRTDPALREELANLFWARFSIDRRLRGETYEQGDARKKEIEFLAIKDQLTGIERWWKKEHWWKRGVEDTGEYESFVAAFTNVEANRYLDGILKRQMDDMGIEVERRSEAPAAVEAAEVPEDMVALGEITDYLAKDEGMTFLLKALQEIVRTKAELSDKDYAKGLFDKLGWKINERFVGEMANSVAEVRKNPKTASARQQGWSILLALLQIFVNELGKQR